MHQHLLVRELAARGHHVKVIAQLPRYDHSKGLLGQTIFAPRFAAYEDGTVPVYPLSTNIVERVMLSPFFLDSYLWRLDRQLRKHLLSPCFSLVYARKIARHLRDADIVHCFNGDFLGHAALRAAKYCGKPFVLTPHVHPGHWLDDGFNLALYRQSDHIFAALRYDEKFYVENGVPPDQITVAGVPVKESESGDGVEFIKSYDIGSEPMILFLGVKRPYKGYRQLLQATAEVWDRFPRACFVFMGARTEDSELLFSNHQDGRVIELEHFLGTEKNSVLAACDVLCLPSVSESFGIVYLEAWMHEKPVIGCRIPSSEELIGEGVDGLLVEQSPTAIAEAIWRLLDQPNLRRRMGQAGRRKVEENYLVETVVDKVEKVYRHLSNS